MNCEKVKIPLKEDQGFDLNFAKNYPKQTRKIFIIYGICFLAVLTISMFIVTMFTLYQVKKLENELDRLKNVVSVVMTYEEDFFNANRGYDDDETYKDPETDSEDDTDSEEYSDDLQNNYFDEYDEIPNLVNGAEENLEVDNVLAANFTKQGKETIRSRRNVVAATQDGVLINSESYAEKKAKNITKNKMYTLKGVPVTQTPSIHSSSWLPYRAYRIHNNSRNINATTRGYHRTRNSSPVYVRKSRVMHTEDKSKAFRQVVKKSSLKSGDTLNSNEQSSETGFTIIRDEGLGRRRYRQRMNMENLDGTHPRVGRIKPLASVHFSGDTSKYVIGQHTNFNGNGHLRHPQRTFVDWKVSDWVTSTGMDRHFTFDNGILTIKESGIYFVYAQIYYLDEHDKLGYRVYKNDDVIFQCTITAHSTERDLKGNTCYTAGVEYLSENDRISLADITEGRYSLFEPGKSFFGVIKLGDIKIK